MRESREVDSAEKSSWEPAASVCFEEPLVEPRTCTDIGRGFEPILPCPVPEISAVEFVFAESRIFEFGGVVIAVLVDLFDMSALKL